MAIDMEPATKHELWTYTQTQSFSQMSYNHSFVSHRSLCAGHELSIVTAYDPYLEAGTCTVWQYEVSLAGN